jgi:hypothetical protein
MNPVKLRLRSLHLLVFFAVAGSAACRIDDSGLSTSPKLQRDGSAPAPDVGPGAGGATGALGGATGAVGGAPGTAGATVTGGGGGDVGSTGGTGTSVGTGGGSAGGTPGAAGATGGDTGTAGGATGTAGDTGATASGGTTGTAGTTGAAGSSATGGVIGTGGTTSTGGTTGTAGTTGTSGTGGTGAGGSPPPSCGPSNCSNGCCNGTQCVRSRTQTFCGAGGAACKPCGRCELCTAAGACDINPDSNWTIVAVSVAVAAQPPRGGNWDPKVGMVGGTEPDPFCQFEMPAHSVSTDAAGVTDTVKDSHSANWNQTISPGGRFIKASDLMSTAKPWRIWVGDDDGCGVQGCVGEILCEIDQPLPASVLRAGQLVKQNYMSCDALTLSFVCQN